MCWPPFHLILYVIVALVVIGLHDFCSCAVSCQAESKSNEPAVPLRSRTSPHAKLFDDRVLADNVMAVRQRISKLPEAERFDALLCWVWPSDTHSTIRTAGQFMQTDPAPVAVRQLVGADIRGGILVSPVFDLLEVATATGRLEELLTLVEALPEPEFEEQRRARAALLVLIHLEQGNQEAAATEASRLLDLVQQSPSRTLAEIWPQTLVVHRGAGHVAVDDLLTWLFVNRGQADESPSLLAWQNQLASLAGRRGPGDPLRRDPQIEPPGITQWTGVSRLRATTRGPGLPQPQWGQKSDRITKISGHDEDYLFFRSPLQGDYELDCDLASSQSQSMVGGTVLGNDGTIGLWRGNLRDGPRRHPLAVPLSGAGSWVHYRGAVHEGTVKHSLNGLLVHTEELSALPYPWVAVRSWSRTHGAVRDLRVVGHPSIPDRVTLSAASDLRGWFPYHEELAGAAGSHWEHRPEPESAAPESTGWIVGHRMGMSDVYFESLLCYQRPLDDVGSVDYEFFYKPGVLEVHPSLDRLALILRPEGVRVHWVTDGRFDTSEVAPDNLFDEPVNRRGPAQLPLKPNAWNQVTLAVNGQQVSLTLNGQLVFESPLEPHNRRTFGLFHYADQTEVQVRNVVLRGNWPQTLPAVAEQELADPVVAKLDAGLPMLSAVFTHDFATDGLPAQYFSTADSDLRGKLTVRPDGVLLVRPGGGDWLDRNIRVPLSLLGDFDVEVAFQQLKLQSDKDACVMLVIELQDEQQHQCRLLRIRTAAQLQQVQASLSVIHPGGARSFSSASIQENEALGGRLRLARRGTLAYYLYAENDSPTYRLIGTEPVSDKPTISDGLLLHALCHGNGETQVVWKSLTLRAARMAFKSDSIDKSP